MSEKKKRNIIIGSLCTVLLLMVVGYAAFQSVLKIKGTSTINSNWDVRITNIEKIENKGATDNEGSPSYDNTNGLSATFNTSFTTPGDYATYKIEITNNGSLDAVLKNITMPENTNNDIIFYLNKNQNNEEIKDALKQNDTLFKSGETGNIGYVYVTVLYRDYEKQQTAQDKTANMTITFDFEQADGNGGTVVPTPQPQTVYAYNEDEKIIGTSTLTESDYKLDYTELESYISGKTWFLKYDIDEEGVIQNAYACRKYTFIDELVCMQGGSADYYASNKAILEGLQTTFEANSGSCSLSSFASFCDVGDSRVNAYSEGHVYVNDNSSNADCVVFSDGRASCIG